MNKADYKYLRSRKKGILTKSHIARLIDKIKNKIGQEFWSLGTILYLDGTGFIYKTNPLDQAFSPQVREWQRANEGLSYECTAKGKKEGSTQAKFMVAISYDQGVVMCEQYKLISGPKSAKMMDNCLPKAFDLSIIPHDRRFVQVGDRSQNSAVSNEIMENLGAEVVSIAARSPEINCIEYFFHLVGEGLVEDTKNKNITNETFEEFPARVQNIIVNFDRKAINSLIGQYGQANKGSHQSKGTKNQMLGFIFIYFSIFFCSVLFNCSSLFSCLNSPG